MHAVDFVRPAVFTTPGSTMIAFGEGAQDRYASQTRGMSNEESRWLTPRKSSHFRPFLMYFLPTIMDAMFPESLTSIKWQGTQSPS